MDPKDGNQNHDSSCRFPCDITIILIKRILKDEFRSEHSYNTTKEENVDENDNDSWNRKKYDAMTRIHPA